MGESGKVRAHSCALLALKDGPKHGYEIAEYIKERSAGFFDYSFGTLYPALHKLEEEGFVKSKWDTEKGAKPKRVYEITKKGRGFLKDEVEHYQAYFEAFLKLADNSP